MLFPPVALILSAIGFKRGRDRVAAMVGMVLGGLCVFFFFGMPLVMALCR